MSKTYTGEERKAAMLEVGAKLAAKHGSVNVTRKMLADAMKPPVAEGLVSHYFGSVDGMRKAVKARAKKLGLVEPDKAKQESIGIKLRAHGPRDARDTRKRSAREVEAIKRKAPAKSTRTTAIIKGAKVTTVRKAPAKSVNKAVGRGNAPVTKVAAKKSVAKVARTAKAPAKRAATGTSVKRVTSKATDQREVKPAPGVDNKATSLPALPPVGPASTPTAPGPDSNKATAARQPKAPPANLSATI